MLVFMWCTGPSKAQLFNTAPLKGYNDAVGNRIYNTMMTWATKSTNKKTWSLNCYIYT